MLSWIKETLIEVYSDSFTEYNVRQQSILSGYIPDFVWHCPMSDGYLHPWQGIFEVWMQRESYIVGKHHFTKGSSKFPKFMEREGSVKSLWSNKNVRLVFFVRCKIQW